QTTENYYDSLETSDDLQTSAACSASSRLLSQSAREAFSQVHPEVCKRFLSEPQNLKGSRVLDLGSGSGRGCYVLGKLVGENRHVTGNISHYHQKRFGYAKPNTEFIQGYVEKLGDAGISNDFMDVVLYKAVLSEVFKVLKVGGELYFSDMYAHKVVSNSLKEDPGMGGILYWRYLISIMKELGFSTPHLVDASHIHIHNPELQVKAGDIKFASGTYRVFKFPQHFIQTKALVTYKGTVPDCPECFEFDASYTFKVDAKMAAILQHTRSTYLSLCFAQYRHLNPFTVADRLGSSVKQRTKLGSVDSRANETASAVVKFLSLYHMHSPWPLFTDSS
uniref:Arsenite methyltransferase n=1 Tax=Electrophorus electricus TaxID=8005 RepID=A0AAY5EVR4_ELEEL